MNKTRTIIIDGIEIQTSLTGVEIADLTQKNKELEQQCKKQKEVIDKLNNHIEDRISILQVKIRHNEKDKYYEGKLIGACKELDMLKSLLKEVSE